MAFDNTDLKDLYKMFMDETMSNLKTLYDDTNMEDEHFSTAVASAVNSSISGAIRVIEVYKKNELVDKQLLDVVSTTTVRNEQSAKDLLVKDEQIKLSIEQQVTEVNKALDIASGTALKKDLASKDTLIKDQQELAERIKNGGMKYIYTYNVDGSVSTKTLDIGTMKSLWEYQSDKILADTNFTDEQKLQLGYSVVFNNRLKATDSYGGFLGNLGMGGLNVPSDMTKMYLDMTNALYNATSSTIDSIVTADGGITTTVADADLTYTKV